MSPVSGRQQRGERHPLDDLALYALDALEADDVGTIEAHLAACAACRQELTAHEEALGALVEDGPPPALWDAVQAQIRDSGPTPVNGAPLHLGSDHAHPDRSARRRGMRRRLAMLAAAAALAAVLGVGLGTRLNDVDNGSGTLAGVSTDGTTVAVLADAHGADVARVVTNEGGDVVILEELPQLAAERTYQLWSVGGPRPVSLGLMGGDGHDATMPVSLPATATKLAISEEPARGSTTPTGPVVASGAVVRPA